MTSCGGASCIQSTARTDSRTTSAEAVYDDIGPAERRRTPSGGGDQLLAARAEGRPVDVLVLARHLSEAAERAMPTPPPCWARRPIAPAPSPRARPRCSTPAPFELTPAPGPLRASLLAQHCRALTLAGDGWPPSPGARSTRADRSGSPERPHGHRGDWQPVELAQVEEALAVAHAEIVAGGVDAVVRSQRPLLIWFSGGTRKRTRVGVGSAPCRSTTGPPASWCSGSWPWAPPRYEQRRWSTSATTSSARAEMRRRRSASTRSAIAGYSQATAGFPDRSLPLVQRSEAMLDDAGERPFRGYILVARVMLDWVTGSVGRGARRCRRECGRAGRGAAGGARRCVPRGRDRHPGQRGASRCRAVLELEPPTGTSSTSKR